jgi:hypothetical protein
VKLGGGRVDKKFGGNLENPSANVLFPRKKKHSCSALLQCTTYIAVFF